MASKEIVAKLRLTTLDALGFVNDLNLLGEDKDKETVVQNTILLCTVNFALVIKL